MAECEDWRNNPQVNPFTNRSIKKNGAVYRKLQQKCGFPHSEENIVKSVGCEQWKDHPEVNPWTNRSIKKGGPVYTKLEAKCGFPNSDCNKWLRDPSTNPKTSRQIREGSLIYKKLVRKCGSPKNKSGSGSNKPKTISELRNMIDNVDEDELQDVIERVLTMFGVNLVNYSSSYSMLYDRIEAVPRVTKFTSDLHKVSVTLNKFVFKEPIVLDICIALNKILKKAGEQDHVFFEDYD